MPITYYTEAELVKFGEHLLSKKREETLMQNYDEGDSVSFEDRFREVYDSDIQDFKSSL